jgi:hypothetical protein
MNAIALSFECKYDDDCEYFEEPKSWICFGWCRKKCIYETYGECKNNHARKEVLKNECMDLLARADARVYKNLY